MFPFIIRQAKSNFDENYHKEIVSVCSVFLVISFLGIMARMVSKRMRKNQFLVDDLLIVWAYILCVGETGMLIWASENTGFGRHLASLSKAQIVSFKKVFYSASLLQPSVLALSKLSILILLYRIFITKAFRTTVLVLMVIVSIWWIAISFAGAFVCSPVRSQWTPDVPGHCGNQCLLNIIDPIPWILTDFAILVAPMPMVYKLHLPTRQRVALAGLFLIGGLTCIVSCVRYRYTFFSLTDPTWDSVGLASWNVIEAHVTVLCACLIASKPVILYLIPDQLFSKIGSYFSRSFETLDEGNNHSRGTAPLGITSRSRLPKHGASFELQRGPNSLHSEGTKSSQEAKDDSYYRELSSSSRQTRVIATA